eukprot:TRINITY_DN11306_c0_g2_i1.p1 TRINITY_DN11306_c0_g2~~TRINITY_DN11306_c0_g2_i1.p1  ORF type:complete len:1449 (+),score=135.57 TRINITY_DN11306_c0_g2_i1:102-4448(+)
MLWKVSSYNPMAITTRRPLALILAVLAPSILALQSTGFRERVRQQADDAYFLQRISHYNVIHFPGKRDAKANAIGVAIALDRNLIPERTIIQIAVPHDELQGRIGFLRAKWRGYYDFGIFAYYGFLHRRASDRPVIEKSNRWIFDILQILPKRCVPLILSDANVRLAGNFWTTCGFPCVGQHGGSNENWPGMRFRSLLQCSELAALNTLLPSMSGPTWFCKEISSRPDVVAIPAQLVRSVQTGYVDYASASILQPSDSTILFDHSPLTFLVEYQDWHFDPSKLYFPFCSWSAAELDAFACDKGAQYRLAKRVDALADEYASQFTCWIDLGLVDDCWGTICHILRTAAQLEAKKASSVERWVSIDAGKSWRAFIDFRNKFFFVARRSSGAWTCSSVFHNWYVQTHSAALRRKALHVQRTAFEKRQQSLLRQMHLALKRGNTREWWRISRILAATHRGPKNRQFYYIPMVRTDVQQCTDFLRQPPQVGGNAAFLQWTGTAWELGGFWKNRERIWRPTNPRLVSAEKLVRDFVNDANQIEFDATKEALNDYVSITSRLQKRPTAKAVPFWSLSRLFWKHALNSKTGLCRSFPFLLIQLLQLIRLECRIPILWNFSQAIGLPKHNGKKGFQGQRLIHLMDPIGVETAYAYWQSSDHTFAENSYAFIPGRRREHPILIFRVAQWRLHKIGRSTMARFWDAKNAYPSLRQEEIAKTLNREVSVKHAWLLAERLFRCFVVIVDFDGKTAVLRFMSGVRQGDAPACHLFIQTADPGVARAVDASTDLYDDIFLQFVDPICDIAVSGASVTYADDVARLGIVKDAKHAMKKLKDWDDTLQREWNDIGIANNTTKGQVLASFVGCDSVNSFRDFQTRFSAVFKKKPNQYVVHLGAIYDVFGGNRSDIAKHVTNANHAWMLHKRFWASAAPLAARLRLFRAGVLPILLTGLSTIVPTREEIDRLETFQMKKLRYFLRGKGRGQTNQAIRTRLRCPTIASKMQAQRVTLWRSILQTDNSKASQVRAVLLGPSQPGKDDQLSTTGRPTSLSSPWVKLLWQDFIAVSKQVDLGAEFRIHGIFALCDNKQLRNFRVAKLYRFDCQERETCQQKDRTERVIKPWNHDFGFAVNLNVCPWCFVRHYDSLNNHDSSLREKNRSDARSSSGSSGSDSDSDSSDSTSSSSDDSSSLSVPCTIPGYFSDCQHGGDVAESSSASGCRKGQGKGQDEGLGKGQQEVQGTESEQDDAAASHAVGSGQLEAVFEQCPSKETADCRSGSLCLSHRPSTSRTQSCNRCDFEDQRHSETASGAGMLSCPLQRSDRVQKSCYWTTRSSCHGETVLQLQGSSSRRSYRRVQIGSDLRSNHGENILVDKAPTAARRSSTRHHGVPRWRCSARASSYVRRRARSSRRSRRCDRGRVFRCGFIKRLNQNTAWRTERQAQSVRIRLFRNRRDELRVLHFYPP